jgi:hypothetical protein
MSSGDGHNITVERAEAIDIAPERMPPVVRRILMTSVGLLLAGAVYLIAVRGEAILVDLSSLGSNVWCF